MGTFLGSYRLEKRSKSHGVSKNSITIGIPIQMSICRSLLLELHLRSLVKSAGKMTSCKSYWVSGAELPDLLRRPHLPTFCVGFNRFENSDAAVASLATRNVLV